MRELRRGDVVMMIEDGKLRVEWACWVGVSCLECNLEKLSEIEQGGRRKLTDCASGATSISTYFLSLCAGARAHATPASSHKAL